MIGLFGPASFFLVLSGLWISELGSLMTKNVTYFETAHAWQAAQNICSQSGSYGKMLTIDGQVDLDLDRYQAWIGQYVNASRQSSVVDSLLLGSNENEINQSLCPSVLYPQKSVFYAECDKRLFFICQVGNGNKLNFVAEAKTWYEAKTHCSDNKDNLAKFQEADLQSALKSEEFLVWIGLYQQDEVWSFGLINDSFSLPQNDSDCVTINSKTKVMAADDCEDYFPFVCMSDSMFLIRENKTWVEALERCRALGLDLLSVQPSDDQDYLMSKVRAADTEEVWTGLRFLADEWLWVDGADVLFTHLPVCPANGQHCGALTKKDGEDLINMNCEEKKNFLCYIF